MRVQATTAKTTTQAKRTARGGSFAVGRGVDRAVAAPAGSVGMLASIDALSVLQGVDEITDAGEIKARAVARGDGLLDDLERLRDGLLEGGLDGGALRGLRRRLGERRPSGADAALAEVLDAIELRCEVELAKRERAAAEAEPAPDVVVANSPSETGRLASRAYGRSA